MTAKLLLVPDSAGYSVQVSPGEIVSVKLDGGLSFQRADIIGGASLVNVSWSALTPTKKQYLSSFFRGLIGRGSEPFLMDLELEDSGLAERTCQYVPDTLRFGEPNGDLYPASFQIEVEAIEADDEYDAAICVMFEAAPDDMSGYVSLLSVIVNDTWPVAA